MAELKEITFKLQKMMNGDTAAVPDETTIALSLTEITVLAKILGGMSPVKYKELGLADISDVYDVIVSDVLNRYFEDGVNEAMNYIEN